MADQNDPESEFRDWWPTGRERWIKESASVRNLVRWAFLAGWQRRDDRLTRIARTPGPVSLPWPKQDEPSFYPEEYWEPADHWVPGRFAGAQDPSMRLPVASEVPEERPGNVIEPAEIRKVPATDDTNPGIAKFEHMGSVWAGTQEMDDTFERLDDAWGAPGPVRSALSYQEEE